MKIGVIGEGDTEYHCLPTLAAKFGHIIVSTYNLGGVGPEFPWEGLMRKRVFPLLRACVRKHDAGRPDKVLIVIDREDRSDCCPDLASQAKLVLDSCLGEENLEIDFSVVLPDPCFECWLFADTTALDNSPLFTRRLSEVIGATTDGRRIESLIKPHLKKSEKWDKVKFGKPLAQRLDLTNPAVLAASRSLRKLVKELQ